MKEKRIIPIWVSVIYGILCVAALCYHGVMYGRADATSTAVSLDMFFECTAFLLALFYSCLSYSKAGAGLLTAFCAVYAIATGALIYQSAIAPAIFAMILLLVRFGILCVFMLAKDLGKKKSMILVIVMIVCELIQLIPQVNGDAIFYKLGKVVLSLVFLFMLIAKYKDKAARGTK